MAPIRWTQPAHEVIEETRVCTLRLIVSRRGDGRRRTGRDAPGGFGEQHPVDRRELGRHDPRLSVVHGTREQEDRESRSGR